MSKQQNPDYYLIRGRVSFRKTMFYKPINTSVVKYNTEREMQVTSGTQT